MKLHLPGISARPIRATSILRQVCTALLIGGAIHSAALEPIRLSEDGTHFVLAQSGAPFRPWGVNYDHDSSPGGGRLLEDYWEKDWQTVEEDFAEIRDLGANTVRIHLQFGRFMSSPEQPDTRALERLQRLLALAEKTGLYLDITGLGCYHKADVPAWYDEMKEKDRWEAQARFWSAVAKACRDSNAVFCYDLMNEPVASGKAKDGWLAGELGGKHYVQKLTLEPAGRSNYEIAEAWVQKLTAAIRKEDFDHLITVGVIPWAMVWPAAKPVFYAPEAARHLDFVSVHFYPRTGEVDKALAALAVYDIGKPLVIEEMFPLACSREELIDFIRRSERIAEGWISFYWGTTLSQYESLTNATMAEAITAQWLRSFKELAPEMRRP